MFRHTTNVAVSKSVYVRRRRGGSGFIGHRRVERDTKQSAFSRIKCVSLADFIRKLNGIRFVLIDGVIKGGTSAEEGRQDYPPPQREVQLFS